jgi:hypothetical protein
MHENSESVVRYSGPDAGPIVRDLVRGYMGPMPEKDPKATDARLDLVSAYNNLPIGYDGILVGSAEDAEGRYAYINATTLDDPVGRAAGEPKITHTERRIEIRPEREQHLTASKVIRRIGEIGLAGIALVGGIYEVGPDPTTAGEIGLAALAYTGTRLGVRIGTSARQRKDATRKLEDFSAWARQPENGAIVFRGPQHMVRLEDETFNAARHEIEFGKKLDAAQGRFEPGNLEGLYAFTGDGEYKNRVNIRPVSLIRELLARDHAPAELWNSGFGESVERLAGIHQQIIDLDRSLLGERKRQDHTGQPRPGVINGLEAEIASLEQDLAATCIGMARLTRERAEDRQKDLDIARAHDLIDQISRTGEDEPHSLELHLQLLQSVACTALAKRGVDKPGSKQLAQRLVHYLEGCRPLLTAPDQMEQFYAGLVGKFGEALELPEWEEVAKQLPRVET